MGLFMSPNRRTFWREARRQLAPVRRLYRLGRLDGLFTLPLFLWFALWASETEQVGLALTTMLIWAISLALYQAALYQLGVAAAGIAILVFVVLKWPVWVGAILALLYVLWLRRVAAGRRYPPARRQS